jgi:hypothetical protein
LHSCFTSVYLFLPSIFLNIFMSFSFFILLSATFFFALSCMSFLLTQLFLFQFPRLSYSQVRVSKYSEPFFLDIFRQGRSLTP